MTGPLETTYLARRLSHAGLQWLFFNSQNDFNEPYFYRAEDSPVFSFLWYDPALRPEQPDRAAPLEVFPGMGMAVMRTGWGHEDTLFTLQYGPTTGHAHADAGTFVLYSRDQMLLIDSGVCGYEMPQYKGYYQTTRAHNTVLVGGEGQVKRLAGKIVEHSGVAELSFVLADATAPYEGRLSRFLRGALFVGGRNSPYYVVVDWLEKESSAPFQWLLHYDGSMMPQDGGYFIHKENAALVVKMLEPSRHDISIRQGYKTLLQDPYAVRSTEERQRMLERADYLEVTPAENSNRQLFVTVLCPYAARAAAPNVVPIAAADWVGFTVSRQQHGRSDLVGVHRHTGSSRTLEDVETDAQLFCVTRDREGRPERALIHGGTYLKVRGRSVLTAQEPVTRAVEL